MSQEYRVPENANVVPKTTMRSDVKRVIVHSRVTEIADDAFRDWSNLAEVVFEPNSRLERIGTHAFTGTALKSFTAPDSLRSIGEGAFAGCKSLKEVRLNPGLQHIGGDEVGAFQDCGLRTAYVPSLLGRLRSRTFAGCKNLRKITVAEGCDVKLEYCLEDGEETQPTGRNIYIVALEEKEKQMEALREQLQKITQLNT